MAFALVMRIVILMCFVLFYLAAPPKAASPEPSGGGGRSDLLAAIRAGKKLKKKSNRAPSKKAAAAAAKPKTLSLMDHLKMKLQARNKVMRGETDASGNSGDAQGLPSLKKDKSDERDDLGIKNVPDTMRMAMHFGGDDDAQSSGGDDDWNSDD